MTTTERGRQDLAPTLNAIHKASDAGQVWAFLKGHCPQDFAERRQEITETLAYLHQDGHDISGIYAALAAYTEELIRQRVLTANSKEWREALKELARVQRDVARALASVRRWGPTGRFSIDEEHAVQRKLQATLLRSLRQKLRELRDRPFYNSTGWGPYVGRPLRRARPGQPQEAREQAHLTLKKLGVRKPERLTLLEAFDPPRLRAYRLKLRDTQSQLISRLRK